MCRLFGFRSVIQSQVHSSLLSAENALGLQSHKHPDGWGVAYYVAGTPHIIKSDKSALSDNLFKRVSGVVSSQTVLAHIRNATAGSVDLLNTHPFQFGPWVFAHNGNIKNFQEKRPELLSLICPTFRRFILGDTDSELLFFYFLSFMKNKNDILSKSVPLNPLIESLAQALKELQKVIGDFSKIDDAGEKETYLTFILTNGTTMISHQGGKKLFYSTYKTKCSDRNTCASFSPSCEAPSPSGLVNHLIFASEPLSGENIWHSQEIGQLIGIDEKMILKKANL